MQHVEGTIRGYGGTELFTQSWLPDGAAGQARAALALAHGYGEHSGRYMNVVQALVPHGYALHGLDLRGHGRSQGRRGHVDRWGDYEEDVRLFLEFIRSQAPDVPLFMLGHSNGGLLALTCGLRYPQTICGVIASAPSLAPPNIAPVLLALGAALSHVWPTFSMASGLDARRLSRIPEVVNAYRNDPLVQDIGSARLSTEMAAAREWVMAHASEWRLPLLLVVGCHDRLIPPQGARQFYERVQVDDKEMRAYPDAYHEVHNDLCAAQEMADLERWLDGHL